MGYGVIYNPMQTESQALTDVISRSPMSHLQNMLLRAIQTAFRVFLRCGLWRRRKPSHKTASARFILRTHNNQTIIKSMQELPLWSGRLMNLYFVIRVENRNKTIRRRYYRLVEAEKLRLAEGGHCQECIRLVCRTLSSRASLRRGLKCCDWCHSQLVLNFT